MKRILWSTFVFGLLFVLADRLQAQNPVYPFFELTDADLARIDLHDGSVNDWLDVLGEPTLTSFDFHRRDNLGYLVPHDPADLDFRIWLAWHDGTNRFYVALERADDVYLNSFDRSVPNHTYMFSHDSSIEFVIDGDAGGIHPGNLHRHYKNNTAEWYLNVPRESQWYTAISEAHDNRPLVRIQDLFGASSQYGDWYARPPYAESDGIRFGERPTISVTEFYVTAFDQLIYNDPSASVVSDLYPGKAVHFSISLVDAEGPFTHTWYSNNSGYTIRITKTLSLSTADGVLVDALKPVAENGEGVAGEGEAEGAVRPGSWGRIKATFDKDIP